MTVARTSEENAEPREWLIRKRGYYYRPDRAGYTASVDEAGRYTETEAKAEAAIQPSIMSAVHQSTVGGTSPVALTSNERFASVLPTADELKMLREAYAETYPVRPLLNEIDRLQKSVDTLNAANRFLSEQLESERVAHETPGELEQLRRIDKAARAFVDACEHKVRIPNGLFAELCDALFDGRPSQETAGSPVLVPGMSFEGLSDPPALKAAVEPAPDPLGTMVQWDCRLPQGDDKFFTLTIKLQDGGPLLEMLVQASQPDGYVELLRAAQKASEQSFEVNNGPTTLPCDHCGRSLDEHVGVGLPCPPVPAREASILKAFARSPRRITCVCGEPNTQGVTHRTDGPCLVTSQR